MTNELDQFEPGEDVTDEFEIPPPEERGIVISIRLSLAEARRLTELAAENGQTLSETSRAALLGFLKSPRRKPSRK
jgi:hypothetical protein